MKLVQRTFASLVLAFVVLIGASTPTSAAVAPEAPVTIERRGGGGCNQYGCWVVGGCNQSGCWNTPRGGCNEYGCWQVGGCNEYGCWQVGGCNQSGCWNTPRGGCNEYGCWR